MDFKDKIKSRRLELGLTLEDVAHKMGVSAPTIQRYESGEIQNMRKDKIQSLANALNLSPAYLMGWQKEKTDANIPHQEPKIIAAYGGGLADVDEGIKEILQVKEKLCNTIYGANLNKTQIDMLIHLVETLEEH